MKYHIAKINAKRCAILYKNLLISGYYPPRSNKCQFIAFYHFNLHNFRCLECVRSMWLEQYVTFIPFTYDNYSTLVHFILHTIRKENTSS